MEQLSRFLFAKHHNDLPFKETFLVYLIPWSFQYCSTSTACSFPERKGRLKTIVLLKAKMDSVSNNSKSVWKAIKGILGKHVKQCIWCSEERAFKEKKKKDKNIPRNISGAHSFSFPQHLTQKFIGPIPGNIILWFLLQTIYQLPLIPKHVSMCFTSNLHWYIPPRMG